MKESTNVKAASKVTAGVINEHDKTRHELKKLSDAVDAAVL